MIDKFSQALTLMREAFEDAQTGAENLASVDLGHVGEFAADCFGPMLGLGPVAAERNPDRRRTNRQAAGRRWLR